MMDIKKIIILNIISVLFGSISYLQGQAYCDLKYDYVWIMGGIDKDTIEDEYGGCEINFNTSPVSFNLHPKPVRMPWQDVSICSKYGDLLFYSNGCMVLDKRAMLMENGDSLNPGEIHNSYCPSIGYIGSQNIFVIPDSYHDYIFYLFHIDLVFNREPGAPFIVQPEHLYCTTIDISYNNGLGKVIDKNKIILKDTSMMGDPMSAVKHANGMDWWIITPNRWTNSFNTILLDNYGPQFEGRQFVGIIPDPYRGGGQGKFSPDGSKFAWYHPLGGVFLYDFDRETGLLSHFRNIIIPPCLQAITGGCEFSPSGQFLYVNHDTSLFQLDVLAPDIQASLTHIADFDKFLDPLPTSFYYMERTPDKRIIMNVLNGSQWLHVIQEPDKKGLACRFEQHAIKLPTVNNFSLPHFPNYRLGSLGEPLCDSLTVSLENPEIAHFDKYKIIPNPASDYFYIETPQWSYGSTTTMSVYDLYGRLMITTNEHDINTTNLAEGIYIVTIREGNKIVQNSKLIIAKN